MPEITINLHMHTQYSDGTGLHADLAKAAIQAGLDAVIITDHNIWVQGMEQYYREGDQQVLVLIGEEVHDQARDPQKNHMLVFGAEREMATFAPDPQNLINQVRDAGGLCFLAHPVDPPAPRFRQQDLSWVNLEVTGFTGIELWNAMTEFKSLLTGYLPAIRYALNFQRVAHGPFPETLQLWDTLLAKGQPVVAVGGSDAHAMHGSLGPIKRILFPYQDHFRAVNTHLLLEKALTGSLAQDKKLIYQALAAGHAFIGYDLPASTKGFSFVAHTGDKTYLMGDQIESGTSATLQIRLPQAAECLLLKDGEVIRSSRKRDTLVHKVTEPGIYRVEVYLSFKGKRRGWIFSNPIYVC
ncbi:MAG: CehA/McbA family metallohydrolase [Anaerolineales bacterium]|nr:CehA/McbA family metallohydrolase [Anaerolineales bacterium]